MASSTRRRARRRVAVLAGAWGLAACTAVPDPGDRYVAPPAGSSWTYAQKNTGSFGRDVQYTVTSGEGRWQDRPVLMYRSNRGTTAVVGPTDGKLAAMLGPDGKAALTWEPPIGWDHPLAVGQQWRRPMRLTVHANDRTFAFDWRCTVSDHGDTTVAAGTLKAFRIECRNTIGTHEVFWFSPAVHNFIRMSVRRDASSPFGVGTQDTELIAYAAPPR